MEYLLNRLNRRKEKINTKKKKEQKTVSTFFHFTFPTTIEAFVPPKPNEFDKAMLTFLSLA